MREYIMNHCENHQTPYTSQTTSFKLCISVLADQHCHKW